MFLDQKCAYFVLCTPFLAIWILLFFLANKETRRHQILRSIVGIFLGIFFETLYFSDYWFPQSVLFTSFFSIPVFIEDAIFGFSVAGIGSTCYETLFSKKRTREKGISIVKKIFIAVTIGVVIYCFSLFLIELIGINSIFATALSMFLFSCAALTKRVDLIRPAILTGAIFLLLLFSIYSGGFLIFLNAEEILKNWWMLYNHPMGVRIANVPLSEIIWAWSFGFASPTLYSGATGVHFKN
ncbi:MAG: lycopene cyclase domain-containing protein [Candidatus Paceibacterota bacterium]